jgi:purine-binding chemotaxis protein CheW
VDDSKKSVLIVEIGGERFMFPVEQVRAVMQQPELTRVPKMPRFVRGMAQVRGEIVPVVDLPSRFDLANGAANSKQQIALLELADITVGVLIDAVIAVSEIDMADVDVSEQAVGICPIPAITGAMVIQERVHFVIDAGLLFDENEIKRAAKVTGAAQPAVLAA